MKTIALLGFMFISITINAQQISSINIVPAAPTTNDSVKVIVSSWFPSGSCDLFQSSVIPNGNSFLIDFTHCIGMLTVICNSTDTFQLGKLNGGSYNVNLNLFTGASGPLGCTGSLSDSKTTSFAVVQFMGMATINPSPFQFVLDNEKQGFLSIESGLSVFDLSIFEITGRTVFRNEKQRTNSTIDLSSLTPGIYFYEAVSSKDEHFSGKIILR